MDLNEVPHIREKALAANLLTAIAGKTSEMIDKFSSWLFIGYGGAVTFIITNADKLANNVPPETLRCAVQVLVPVAILAILEKALAVFVGAGSAGAEAGRKIEADAAQSETPPHLPAVFNEITSAIFWPMRMLARRGINKVQAGNLTAQPRLILGAAQWQGLLTLGQAGCVLYAIIQLAASVRF